MRGGSSHELLLPDGDRGAARRGSHVPEPAEVNVLFDAQASGWQQGDPGDTVRPARAGAIYHLRRRPQPKIDLSQLISIGRPL